MVHPSLLGVAGRKGVDTEVDVSWRGARRIVSSSPRRHKRLEI